MKAKKTKIRFVDVKKYGFAAEPRYYFYGWSETSKIMGRQSAVKTLVRVRKLLPKGYNFKIWDCKRVPQTQIAIIDSFNKRINMMYLDLSKKDKEKLLLRFTGGLLRKTKRLGTHQRGGSLDLTIVDKKGRELYMGTDFDDITEKAATNYFEKKRNPTIMEKEARKNRRLFKKTMEKAGFRNYTQEWWHWSYDK